MRRKGSLSILLIVIAIVGVVAVASSLGLIKLATINVFPTDVSWSPKVSCVASVVTIEQVTGPNYNTTSGGSFQAGGWQATVSDKRFIPEPCSDLLTGNSTFVEIKGVWFDNRNTKWDECINTSYPGNCDLTININSPGYQPSIQPSGQNYPCPSGTNDCYRHRIHTEIDMHWNQTNQAPEQYAAGSTPVNKLVDVQGFVYWDNGHKLDQWHSYSGWEIHPLTAWRLSGASISSVPVGQNICTSKGTGTLCNTSVFVQAGTSLAPSGYFIINNIAVTPTSTITTTNLINFKFNASYLPNQATQVNLMIQNLSITGTPTKTICFIGSTGCLSPFTTTTNTFQVYGPVSLWFANGSYNVTGFIVPSSGLQIRVLSITGTIPGSIVPTYEFPVSISTTDIVIFGLLGVVVIIAVIASRRKK